MKSFIILPVLVLIAFLGNGCTCRRYHTEGAWVSSSCAPCYSSSYSSPYGPIYSAPDSCSNSFIYPCYADSWHTRDFDSFLLSPHCSGYGGCGETLTVEGTINESPTGDIYYSEYDMNSDDRVWPSYGTP